jgi:flagellar assembly protein FliH
MSSRARRVADRSVVVPFDWQRRAPARLPEAPVATEPIRESAAHADPAVQQQHLASLERDAFAKGFAQGERAGADAAATRGDAVLRRLGHTLEELTALRAQIIRNTEEQMVRLALAIARRIVHREVSLDRDLLVAMARVALDRLGDSTRVSVHLNPQDYEETAAACEAQWMGTHVTVTPDARVARGGCRIESAFGAIEAGADQQIDELAQALLGQVVTVPDAITR